MKFYRKTQGAVLGGVCLGLAQETKTDPFLVRILTLGFFVFSAGVVGLIYLILWTVLPAEDSNTTIREELLDRLRSLEPLKGQMGNPRLAGGILLALGAVLLLGWILPMEAIVKGLLPLALVAGGIWLLYRSGGSGKS